LDLTTIFRQIIFPPFSISKSKKGFILKLAQMRVRGRVSSRYSFRSATIGSTFVARRAGIQQANNATLINKEATAMKVRGSF